MTLESMELDEGPLNFQCSIIQRAVDTATQPISFRDALQGIICGHWSRQVMAVQNAYASGGKDAASKPKKELPGILFSGTFTKRSSQALVQHSGLICADLDDLKERVASVKELIVADPHVLAAFVSPTGAGLKVVFRCDPTKPHAEAYHALEHYMLDHFGLQIDEKCSDVSRICFVSHDPEAFVAESAEVLPYPEKAPEQPREYTKSNVAPGSALSVIDDFNLRGPKDVPEILEASGWTHTRGKYWCRPGKTGETSASWEHFPNTFHVFSSAPETGFPSDQKGFDPFGVYCHLVHHGDSKAAVRALGRAGYGPQTAPKSIQQQNLDRLAGPLPEITPHEPEKTDDVFSRRVRLQAPPPEPVTRLFLAGKPIATPGNLVTLISRAKTGKTATIGAAVAAIIGAHYDRHDIDTFGFTAPHTDEAVVLIDTEQSPYDAWTCHSRSMARANQPTDPEWLHHYALVGFGAKKLRTSLPPILDKAVADHKGVFTLILDGVADFVPSVNDEVGCSEFISWLRDISVKYNCPVICVIHSNEGVKTGDDGRGWLGKELTRKAESNLLLKKTGEITTITSEKQRKAPITEKDGVAFRWDDQAGRHVTCEPSDIPQRHKGGRPKGCTFEMLESIWPKTADKALTMPQLLKYAKDEEDVSESTLRRIIKEAVQTGQLTKISGPIGPQYYMTF